MNSWLGAIALLTALTTAPPSAQTTEASTEARALAATLRPVDQALLDAFPAGDRAAWARVIGPGFQYVAEDEQVIDGAKLLSLLTPPTDTSPANDWKPFHIRDWRVMLQGDVALVIHHDEETGSHLGSPVHGVDLTSETWRRMGGEWKLLLVHTTPIPTTPPAATLRSEDLEPLTGAYRAASQSVTIRRDGDGLAFQVAGGPPVHLTAEARDVFFNQNPRQRTIFHRDAAGRVTELLVRNENRAIVYARIE